MAETSMRRRVVKALRRLDAVPVENSALDGTPDVEYRGGWIELKRLPAWPARPDTIVRIPHFTKEQRVFHIRRRSVGGRSWLLVQCKREWLLLDGAVAALNIGLATHRDLCDLAVYRSSTGLHKEELVKCICMPTKKFCLIGGDKEKLRLLLRASTM